MKPPALVLAARCESMESFAPEVHWSREEYKNKVPPDESERYNRVSAVTSNVSEAGEDTEYPLEGSDREVFDLSETLALDDDSGRFNTHFDDDRAYDDLKKVADKIARGLKHELVALGNLWNPQVVNAPRKRSVTDIRATEESAGSIVTIRGDVSSVEEMHPVATSATFTCKECDTTVEKNQDVVNGRVDLPDACPSCEDKSWYLEEKTDHVTKQEVIIEENLEDTDGQPADIKVHLLRGLAGVMPGESVEVTGIIHNEYRKLKHLDAEAQLVAIGVQNTTNSQVELTEEDREELRGRVEGDGFRSDLVDSFASHLVGMDAEKRAVLATLLTGGEDIELPGDESIRPNSHILLIGSPGSGKSQLLQAADKISPRGEYTSADNSSEKGLTASVVEDDRLATKHTLKAGMLPRSHQGVAAVDEMDKISSGYDALHTPLSDNVVEREVWGQSRTMPAKVRGLIAANPNGDDWDEHGEIVDQFGFKRPFLDRFDLTFAVRSKSMAELGDTIAEGLTESILAAQGDLAADGSGNAEPSLSTDDLRKFVKFAWEIEPSLTRDALMTIHKGWVDTLPQDADLDAREYNGLLRLSRAFARMRLDDEVTVEDACDALETWRDSLETYARDDTGELDMGLMREGISEEESDLRDDIREQVGAIEEEKNRGAVMGDLFDSLDEQDGRIAASVSTLMEQGVLYEPASEGDYRVS